MNAYDLLSEPIQRSLWRMGWTALRPLQSAAIHVILESQQDLILSARTAAGKTEAAFLPILSRICEHSIGSIRAVYVGPLKALINDQFRRLEQLCEYAEIPVHRWHGDVSGDRKRKLVERPGGVLLITPESLESLLVNRSAALGRIVHSLAFVVIDELHALIGNERGTQLRSQLYRLDRYTVTRPRLVALSATIGDIRAASRWLRPDEPLGVHILEDDSGEKQIRFRLHGYLTQPVTPPPRQELPQTKIEQAKQEREPPAEFFTDLFEACHGAKNLVFANSKSTVELLTDRLNELGRKNGAGERYLIHHGSLSKEIREETERMMQTDGLFTAICSSTLELGIDIGNVRAVGQVGPCWSVSSQVQRLGRSGRGDGEAHQMRVFITEDEPAQHSPIDARLYTDLLQAIAITELMLERWCEAPNVSPIDFSTLVQQILSIITECGGATAELLHDRLVKRGAFRIVNAMRLSMLLKELGKHDLIEQQSDGMLILGLVGEQIVRHYDFYAAFLTPPEYRVLHDGRVIGQLSATAVPSPDDHILLAGKRWVVIGIDHEREEVMVRPARGRKPPIFTPGEGEIAPEIRRKMRHILQSTDVPAYLNPLARKMLDDARHEAINSGLAVRDIIYCAADRIIWFPWTGTRAMRTLNLLFRYANIYAELQSRRLSFELESGSDSTSRMKSLLDSPPQVQELCKQVPYLERRKWDHFVPRPLLEDSFASDCLDLPLALKCLHELNAALS